MNITKQYKTAMGDAAPVSPPFHDIWSQTKNGRPHFEPIAPEATLGMSHFFPFRLGRRWWRIFLLCHLSQQSTIMAKIWTIYGPLWHPGFKSDIPTLKKDELNISRVGSSSLSWWISSISAAHVPNPPGQMKPMERAWKSRKELETASKMPGAKLKPVRNAWTCYEFLSSWLHFDSEYAICHSSAQHSITRPNMSQRALRMLARKKYIGKYRKI